MYAQLITPGFKMLLAAGGSTHTYDTSINRVVFLETPSGVDIRSLLIAIEIIDAQDTVSLDFGRTIGSILVEGQSRMIRDLTRHGSELPTRSVFSFRNKGTAAQPCSPPSELARRWRR